MLEPLRAAVPGVMLCGVLALAAGSVSGHYGGPLLLHALFFGIAFHFLHDHPQTREGVDWCAKNMLRIAIALFGARITSTQIAALGVETLLIVAAAVASTLLLGVGLARAFRLQRWQGLIAGGAVAICGASAALAISAAIAKPRDREAFTLLVVVSVTVFSTAAGLLYPALVSVLGWSDHEIGLFLGATIHDVGQVVVAGYSFGQQAGDFATIVKLFRIALLALVVIVVAYLCRDDDGPAGDLGPRHRLLPWFLWVFAALVVVNSLGGLTANMQGALHAISRILLVVAIAVIGVRTSFAAVAQSGWRPLALIAAESAWLALFVGLAIHFTRH